MILLLQILLTVFLPRENPSPEAYGAGAKTTNQRDYKAGIEAAVNTVAYAVVE